MFFVGDPVRFVLRVAVFFSVFMYCQVYHSFNNA
jgi:hypothetical protein